MNRRRALATGAAGVCALTTGCLQLVSGPADRIDEATRERERLCHVGVTSEDRTPHSVTVVVERGGEVVRRERFDLPDHDPEEPPYDAVHRTLERTWPVTPGHTRLRARTDGAAWDRFDFEDGPNPTDECWLPEYHITADGDTGWLDRRRPTDEVPTPEA